MNGKMSDHLFDRRHLIATIGLLGISVATPQCSFAGDELYTNIVECPAYPDLTHQEFLDLCQANAEAEAERVISQALKLSGEERSNRGRPTYETVYEAQRVVNSPWKRSAGQPPGGTKVDNGGGLYVTTSGLGSIDFSYSFPTPYGDVGFSGPLGGQAVSGVLVEIDSSGYYVVEQLNIHYATPYRVYEVKDGVRRLYAALVSKSLYRSRLRAVRT